MPNPSTPYARSVDEDAVIDAASCLSERLGPLGPRVKALSREYARIWGEISSDPYTPDRLFTLSEKKDVERDLSLLIRRLSAEKKKFLPPGHAWESAEMEEFAASLRPCLKRILGRVDLHLEAVYDARFVDSTRHFLRAVRDFDPEIRISSVYQALRNVWIMNTLQFFLGQKVELSDAIFGYSMIYPYLDNFIDDAGDSESDKLAQVLKLKRWLEGVDERPETPREEKLHALIGLIERQFSRREYPEVFQSMLAIYNAQIRSLLQQRETNPPHSAEILDISLEKGGTSVLADGYLVAGSLEPGQQDFCFGFGTFLQLADDLQDIAEDLKRGHSTLFSQTAGQLPLDPLLYKLFRYVYAVVERTLDASLPREQALREVIPRGSALMHMESVSKYPSFFSRACVRGCQKAYPVRFSYLRKLRRALPDKFLTNREKISDLDPYSIALMTISSRAFSLD